MKMVMDSTGDLCLSLGPNHVGGWGGAGNPLTLFCMQCPPFTPIVPYCVLSKCIIDSTWMFFLGMISWEEYHTYFLQQKGFSREYAENHDKKHRGLNRSMKGTCNFPWWALSQDWICDMMVIYGTVQSLYIGDHQLRWYTVLQFSTYHLSTCWFFGGLDEEKIDGYKRSTVCIDTFRVVKLAVLL
jgi:hypothetical protein